MTSKSEKNGGTAKTNRIFNAFNPIVYKNMVLVAVFALLVFITDLFYKSHDLWFLIGILLVFVVVVFFDRVLHCPSRIEWTNNVVFFNDHISIKKHIGRGGRVWRKVSYTVYDVYKIEFRQNSIERRFNVGRVSFSGHMTFEAKKDAELINPKSEFCIYGIKDFSHFKTEFSKIKCD